MANYTPLELKTNVCYRKQMKKGKGEISYNIRIVIHYLSINRSNISHPPDHTSATSNYLKQPWISWHVQMSVFYFVSKLRSPILKLCLCCISDFHHSDCHFKLKYPLLTTLFIVISLLRHNSAQEKLPALKTRLDLLTGIRAIIVIKCFSDIVDSIDVDPLPFFFWIVDPKSYFGWLSRSYMKLPTCLVPLFYT